MINLEAAVLRWGAPKVTAAIAIVLVSLFVGGLFGFAKVKAWYYQHQDAKHVSQRDQAREETKIARQDEAQVTRSSAIGTATVAAQDAHGSAQRTAAAAATEVIHERIRKVPVVVPVPDDPVVRASVDEALRRAQAAADRVRGTPGD